MTFVKIVVPLMTAIRDRDGNFTNEITFPRKMRVGDLRVFDEAKGEHDGMIRLTAKITELPPSVIESIDLDDWPAVLVQVNNFLLSFKALADALKASRTTSG